MAKKGIEVIYEDDDLLVINKPAKLLSIGDSYNTGRKNAMEMLKQTREELLIVHRLDIDTSGVMIFAKNAEAHRHLSLQFEHREVKKYYMAFITGYPEKEGRIEAPIAESMASKGRMVINKRGKNAITTYKVLSSYRNNISLVEVNLLTGRRHQIRLHMAYNGTPLLVDKEYKGKDAVYVTDIKKRINKPKEEMRPLLDRVSLHSSSLTIKHPKTNEIMTFTGDFPKDMHAVYNQLEKTKK